MLMVFTINGNLKKKITRNYITPRNNLLKKRKLIN
jgi:hypothetical protein